MQGPPIAGHSTHFCRQNPYKIFQNLKETPHGPVPDVILNQKCLIYTSPARNGEGDKSIRSKQNKLGKKVVNRVFIDVGR